MPASALAPHQLRLTINPATLGFASTAELQDLLSGLLTGARVRMLELKAAGLARYFDIVLAGDTLPEKKPHPLPLLHAAKFFGCPIENLLLVGDSLSDAQAARAAGCPIICVPYGYNHGEPVETLNVDAVIPDLLGVLPLIARA